MPEHIQGDAVPIQTMAFGHHFEGSLPARTSSITATFPMGYMRCFGIFPIGEVVHLAFLFLPLPYPFPCKKLPFVCDTKKLLFLLFAI